MSQTNKYQNGKIYTIRCKTDDKLIYVGSTIQPLYKRFWEHKKKCFDETQPHYTKYLYRTIREMNNINDWYIELYETFSCNSKEELHKREGEIIRELGNLNTKIEGRTDKEYYEDNKERYKEKYAQNKEIYLNRVKIYRENNKEKVQEQSKRKYEKHKEAYLQKQKEYRENNKDRIKERDSEKIICECGCEVRKDGLRRHIKTQKHIQHSKGDESKS